MPKRSRKRKREEDGEKQILKKIRKLEKKIRRRHRRKDSSSESSDISSHDSTSKEDANTHIEEPDSDSMNNYDILFTDEDLQQENNVSTAPPPDNESAIPGTSSTNNDKNITSQPSDPLQMDQSAAQSTQQTKDNSNQPPDKTLAAGSSSEVKEPELDKDILDLLGEAPSKDIKYGPKVNNELSVRWYHILTTGLTKEIRKELIGKYPVPENCKNIDAPIFNPEAESGLTENVLKKDKALENKQKQRAAALSSLGEVLTRLFELKFKDTSVIKPLLDAARLICDLQHHDSLVRRSFVSSTFKKDVKKQLYNMEIDKFLFSEKMADTLKAAKVIQKSGTDMKISSQPKPQKSTTRTNRPLNSKPPLPSHRPAGVWRKQEPAAEPSRRRYPAQPTTSAAAPSRPRPRSQVQRRR